MSDALALKALKAKLEYLGYKKGIESLNLNNSYNQLIKELQDLGNYELPKFESISFDEVKKAAFDFYKKYFNIHNIKYINEDMLNSESFCQGDLTVGEAIKLLNDFYSLAKEVSPFDLPIELVDGHSMFGEVRKPLIVIPDDDFNKEMISDENRVIPFSKILLGNDLTQLSSATLIHEIGHVQQESIPGYAESILNKEVLSIFLEKLAALELDPSMELLKASEKNRFSHLLYSIRNVKINNLAHNLTQEELLRSYIYIQSTLFAEKLFDLYLNERKQKKKDKYIYEIQDVFDGKIQVEDMLNQHDVTLQKAKDINLVKRHK